MSRAKAQGHYDGDGCVFPDPGHFAKKETQVHPIIRCADDVLARAAVLLGDKWTRGLPSVAFKPYGIHEALDEAAEGDVVAKVIAERQCVVYGLDVWWNDLVCTDAEDAQFSVGELVGIDGRELYGLMWEANVGLLVLANQVTADHINGMSNMMHAENERAFEDALEVAAGNGLALQLQRLCEDIHFVIDIAIATPAAVARRLKGIRALECVAAHHVLHDLIPMDMKRALVAPAAKILLPFTSVI